MTLWRGKTVRDRLLDGVVAGPNCCWIWTGALNTYGYAQMKVSGQKPMVHRLAYESFVGEIPVGMEIDHLCRVRHCVNPAHLEVVTPRENTLRGDGPAGRNARKTACPQGHPYDEGNTLHLRRGGRRCKQCHADYVRRWRHHTAAR